MEEGVAVCGVSKAAGVDTFDDMRSKEVIIGGSAPNSALVKSALAVRNLFGVKDRDRARRSARHLQHPDVDGHLALARRLPVRQFPPDHSAQWSYQGGQDPAC
jgi:hypothetical protein